MLEILGILVAIGVFVFWCDVTDSWNNVFRWAKTLMDPRRAALAYHQTRAAQEQTADREVEALKQVCADSGQYHQHGQQEVPPRVQHCCMRDCAPRATL